MPAEPPIAAMTQETPPRTSGLAPLRIPLFRDRWVAATVSNLGTWMQDTAGTWLMTTLTASPLLIALMQTAASLPILVFGLLGGATADLFDRRRLLIFWQTWMLGSVAVLALLTFLGYISPWSLLTLTFLLNVGSAMNNPAWQAIVPELVPRELIPDAVSLNSGSFNLARALGPALGGLMVAAFTRVDTGSAWVFALNSLSFAGVIWVLVNWKRVPLFRSALPAERIPASVRTGVRYVRHSPNLRAALVRAFTFMFFVSAIWSLLAVVAHDEMHQGALGYGILNGSLGTGAVISAFTLTHVRRRLTADQLIAVATAYDVVLLALLALVHRPAVVIPALVGAGFFSAGSMATLNTSVQVSVPAWVKARALGAYLMTYQGAAALGSALWGAIAERAGTTPALLCAAAGFAVTFPLVRRFHILPGGVPDTTPHEPKRLPPELVTVPDDLAESADPELAGPVRISIEYRVPVENYAEFTRAIHRLRRVRLRGGALRWGIYRDVTDPTRLNETFIAESWLDYLRSRERATASDVRIRQEVWALHAGAEPPQTSFQVYAREIANPTPPPRK